jgi:hypothetical protein
VFYGRLAESGGDFATASRAALMIIAGLVAMALALAVFDAATRSIRPR